MHASVGDRIIVRGHHLAEPTRQCVVIEVRGPDGGPPYLVEWDESDHSVLFFPGNDAEVEHQRTSRGATR
jgi:hypothetical protein